MDITDFDSMEFDSSDRWAEEHLEEIGKHKAEVIEKVLDDLPTNDMRYEMGNDEWYHWFEEVYDKAFKKGKESVSN